MNIFSGKTTWKAICGLSRRMTNGMEEHGKPHPNFVFMADHSFGDRKAIIDKSVGDAELYEWLDEAKDGVIRIEDTAFSGAWIGYFENQSMGFVWTSFTSGAKVSATRQNNGSWELEFRGCETASREESGYIHDFVLAVEEIIEIGLDNPEAIRKTIKSYLEQGHDQEIPVFQKFAEKIGIKLD